RCSKTYRAAHPASGVQGSSRDLRRPGGRGRHQITVSLCWQEIATPLRGSQRGIASALTGLAMTDKKTAPAQGGHLRHLIRVPSFPRSRVPVISISVISICGSRPISRVLYLAPSPYPLPLTGDEVYEEFPSGDHLPGAPVVRHLEQPTRRCGGPPHLPLCGLAPGGVCPGLRSPGASCALTARLHPYPSDPLTLPSPPSQGARSMRSYQLAVCFCGTFLGVAPTGSYPAPCPLVSGLSSEDVWSSAVARPAPAPILALRLTRRNEASLDVVTSKAQPDPFLFGETLALRPEFSDPLDDFVAGRFEGLGARGAVPLHTKRRDPRDVEFVFLLDYRGELKGRL